MVHNYSLLPIRKGLYFIPEYIFQRLFGGFPHRLTFNAVIGVKENYVGLSGGLQSTVQPLPSDTQSVLDVGSI